VLRGRGRGPDELFTCTPARRRSRLSKHSSGRWPALLFNPSRWPGHQPNSRRSATTADLDRLCDAGASVLYDAVGWQAPGEEFAFHGARITAVISQAQNRPHLPDVPDLWTAEGDSLRLEDGQLVPRTLGELRTRYGQAVTDDNVDPGADDFDGFGTVSCRFPYLLFKLGFNGHGIIPDSARISSLEMWVPPPSGFDRVCHR